MEPAAAVYMETGLLNGSPYGFQSLISFYFRVG